MAHFRYRQIKLIRFLLSHVNIMLLFILVFSATAMVAGYLSNLRYYKHYPNQINAIWHLRKYYFSQHVFLEYGLSNKCLRDGSSTYSGKQNEYALPFSDLYNDRALHKSDPQEWELVWSTLIPRRFSLAINPGSSDNGYFYQDDPRIRTPSSNIFGLYAIPAEHTETYKGGVMTYFVNHTGKIWQKYFNKPINRIKSDEHPEADASWFLVDTIARTSHKQIAETRKSYPQVRVFEKHEEGSCPDTQDKGQGDITE